MTCKSRVCEGHAKEFKGAARHGEIGRNETEESVSRRKGVAGVQELLPE